MARTESIGALALILRGVTACGGEDRMTVDGDILYPYGKSNWLPPGCSGPSLGDGVTVTVTPPGGGPYVATREPGRQGGDAAPFAFTVEGVAKARGDYQVSVRDYSPVVVNRADIGPHPRGWIA